MARFHTDYIEMALLYAYPLCRSLTCRSPESHYNWLCYWACMTFLLPLCTLTDLGRPCKLLWALTLAANDAKAARWMVEEASRDPWLQAWRAKITRWVEQLLPWITVTILRGPMWLGELVLILVNSNLWQHCTSRLSSRLHPVVSSPEDGRKDQ